MVPVVLDGVGNAFGNALIASLKLFTINGEKTNLSDTKLFNVTWSDGKLIVKLTNRNV
jgi:hypothetical protein